jgi:hypothetical protein
MNADDLEGFRATKRLYQRYSEEIDKILHIQIGKRTTAAANRLCQLYEAREHFCKGLDLLWPNWRTEE